MKPAISIGDTVINDLDGQLCIVTDIKPRDHIGPVTLFGHEVYLTDKKTGTLAVVFEWEVTPIKKD